MSQIELSFNEIVDWLRNNGFTGSRWHNRKTTPVKSKKFYISKSKRKLIEWNNIDYDKKNELKWGFRAGRRNRTYVFLEDNNVSVYLYKDILRVDVRITRKDLSYKESTGWRGLDIKLIYPISEIDLSNAIQFVKSEQYESWYLNCYGSLIDEKLKEMRKDTNIK